MVLLRCVLVTFLFALTVIHCQDAGSTPAATEESTTAESTTVGGDVQTTASSQSEATTSASSSASTTVAPSSNGTGTAQASAPTGSSRPPTGCHIQCVEVPESGSDGSNQPDAGAISQPAIIVVQGLGPYGRPFGPAFHPGFRPFGVGPFGFGPFSRRRPYRPWRRFRPNRFRGYRRPMYFDEVDGANDEMLGDQMDDVADEMDDSSQTGFEGDQMVPEGRMLKGNNEKMYMCKKVCP